MIRTAAVTIRVSAMIGGSRRGQGQWRFLRQDVAALAHAFRGDASEALFAIVVVDAAEERVGVGVDRTRRPGGTYVPIDVGVTVDHSVRLLPAGAQVRRCLILAARRLGPVVVDGLEK